MRTITIAMTLILMTSSLYAQYFKHWYGAISGISLGTDGLNTRINPPGYAMTNATDGPQSTRINITYADINGHISASHFNKVYEPASPREIFVPRKIIELKNGFGVVGTISNNALDVFYLRVDQLGNVLGATEYSVGPPQTYVEADAACVSASGKELYVTGTVADYAGSTKYYVYVMKLDIASGVIIWSNIYDFTYQTAVTCITESPFTPLGVPEVVIGGQLTYTAGGMLSPKGMFCRINANTGATIGSVKIIGNASSDEGFNAMTITHSTSGGSMGYMLAGSTTQGIGVRQLWLSKMDPTGAMLWSTRHSLLYYPTAPEMQFNDIIERQNPITGSWEYYEGGKLTDTGIYASGTAIVAETDEFGLPTYPQNIYHFRDALTCFKLDQYTGTAHDGLSLFGVVLTSTPLEYMYLAKSDFNGRTGCNDNSDFSMASNGPTLLASIEPASVGSLFSFSLPMNIPFSTVDTEVCYNLVLPKHGSTQNIKEEDELFNISPNPLYEDRIVNISLPSDLDGQANIIVINELGSCVFHNNYSLSKGNNHIKLDMSKINAMSGIYNIIISGPGNNRHTEKLLIR